MTVSNMTGFGKFSAEATGFCEGISDLQSRAYALNFLCYLQSQARGLIEDQPKSGRLRLQEARLIRQELSRLYQDCLEMSPPRRHPG